MHERHIAHLIPWLIQTPVALNRNLSQHILSLHGCIRNRPAQIPVAPKQPSCANAQPNTTIFQPSEKKIKKLFFRLTRPRISPRIPAQPPIYHPRVCIYTASAPASRTHTHTETAHPRRTVSYPPLNILDIQPHIVTTPNLRDMHDWCLTYRTNA